jgi:alkanesulfonate monooxygenase SsuD/methylene tetrahydromethanopterin reductase-like flavin-dependent oxidoreductase (luciferase family)
MADEYMDVVNQLWDSWSAKSVVNDVDGGMFADPEQVAAINFEGTYYKVRGPLNSGPLPQGRPAIAQAGTSPRGREFAARHAHAIVCDVEGVPAMKAYRDDVRSRALQAGRNPDDVKVMYVASPVLGGTEREAAAKAQQQRRRDYQIAEQRLAFLSKATNIDFAAVIGLDEPIGDQELRTNGHQQSLAAFQAKYQGKTLRQAGAQMGFYGSVELVGTPDSVAAQMDEVMAEVGGDGFLLHSDSLSGRVIAEITDGLIPALQARGLTRAHYEHTQLTDNLLAF